MKNVKIQKNVVELLNIYFYKNMILYFISNIGLIYFQKIFSKILKIK